MQRFPWVLVVAVLVGCAPAAHENLGPSYRILPGTMVALAEPLAVPAGQARVFLQGGEVRAKRRLAVYRPHCNFELRQVSDGSARIEPDHFTITDVRTGDEGVVMRPVLHPATFWQVEGDDHPGQVSRYVHYALRSARQPQVLRLTCHGGFDFPGRAELPSLEDIRQALGRYAAFIAAEGV